MNKRKGGLLTDHPEIISYLSMGSRKRLPIISVISEFAMCIMAKILLKYREVYTKNLYNDLVKSKIHVYNTCMDNRRHSVGVADTYNPNWCRT